MSECLVKEIMYSALQPQGRIFNLEDVSMLLTINRTFWLVTLTLFLMTPVFATAANAETKTDDSQTYNWKHYEDASQLLREIQGLSARLAEDSFFLEQSSRWNQLDWRSHATELRTIRDNVNAMGRNLQQLQEVHGTIAPWQQKAVERIMPNALELAAHTESAIAHLNEEQGKLWTPEYIARFSAMTDHAEEINDTVSTFLDYGRTSDRLKGLQRQMEITES